MSSVTGRQVIEDGTLDLRCDPEPRAPVKCSLAAEGWGPDSDGVMVHLLLWVKDGLMTMLEIYKDDGSEIRRPPNPAELEVFTPYGEAGVWSAAWPKGSRG